MLPSPFGRGAGGEGVEKTRIALTLTLYQRERGHENATLTTKMQPSMTNRRLSAAALLACAVWGGCRPGASGDDRPLVVVVSGDTAGYIAPCRCASNQSGGLPRRATYVERLRGEADVILADTGGAPGGTSPYDLANFEAILRGEVAMGIAAHNIGAAEATLGADELRRLAKELNVPLVSANVLDGNGELVAERLRIVRAVGRRVALVGVLGEQYATDQLTVTPPARAVLGALKTAAGKYDALIVLAYLEAGDLEALAGALPGADVIVAGPDPVAPKPLGPRLLASVTNQGKFLAHFDAPRPGSSGRWTGKIVELTEQFADDPQQAANIERFREELAKRDFTPADTSFADPLWSGLSKSEQIAGNARCRECHAEDCHLWEDSAHARAWESLQSLGTEVDPECQRCHTTGYGRPGGFVSIGRTPGPVNVGCESCHGPALDHADDPDARDTPSRSLRAEAYCVGCHDRDQSPQFVYDEYWAKIEHGEPDTAGTSRAERPSE